MALLNQQQQSQVAEAISNAERQTDAELVTVLARQADDYTYIPLLWASVLALLLPSAVNYFPQWLSVHQLILCQWAVFIGSRVQTTKSSNTTNPPRSAALARQQFSETTVFRTKSASHPGRNRHANFCV